MSLLKLFVILSISGLFLVTGYGIFINLFDFFEIKVTPLPYCPEISPLTVGIQPVKWQIQTWYSMMENQTGLQPGGHYTPQNCKSRHRVAIIVPYRNRNAHLRIFLNNIHPFLQRQQLDYRIFIIQQVPALIAFRIMAWIIVQMVLSLVLVLLFTFCKKMHFWCSAAFLKTGPFNRGMLLNIGFTEAQRIYNFTCFIFHDVDLIPENDKNPYNCVDSPRHLSVAVDVFQYQLPFKNIFGGAIAMQADQFKSVNGFSNQFFGWGGEDDDLFNRVNKKMISIFRYPEEISRYTMIKHVKQYPNPQRFKILKESNYEVDGLNSLNYKLDLIEERDLFTLVAVDLKPA